MIAADLFFELAYLACRISKALHAVLLEFTLHLYAQLSNLTSSYPHHFSRLPF